MAAIAQVQDGKIVESSTQTSLNQSTGTGSTMDKDTFLQLLVAQMKYQDPLEPTSNTEYIAQYATFSQVEQMQSMASTMELSRASSMVGQEVWITTTTSSGQTKYIQGQVDYVVYENGKAYVSVEEQLYPIEQVDTIVDKTYNTAYTLATELVARINQLPGINGIDLTDCEEIDELEKIYDDMTDYQKQFVAKEKVDALEAYIEKAKEVRLAAEQAGSGNDTDTDNASSGGEDTE